MPEHYPLLGNPQSQALSIEHDGREDRERSIGNSTCAPVLTQPGQWRCNNDADYVCRYMRNIIEEQYFD